MEMEHRYAVIMAGGRGERFWPESREERPKQMLALFSEKSLIEQTVLRVHGLVPHENMLILTNRAYVETMRGLLPEIPPENIIGEPARRDTAPCIALASGIVRACDPKGVMMVFPADHVITGHAAFTADMTLACGEAQKALVTLGIRPAFPSPDYGYIEAETEEKVSGVRRFVEKPAREEAVRLVRAGNFYWNAGIFAWGTDVIRAEFEQAAPDLGAFMDRTACRWGTAGWREFLETEFPEQRKISIDYAVMEKSSRIRVVRADFEWDDVGNWNSLRNHIPADDGGNVLVGTTRLLNCRECIVFSRDKEHLVAGIDLKDMVVIHSGNATLVCPNSSTAKLKELLKGMGDDVSLANYL